MHVLAVHLTPLMQPYTERGWRALGATGGVLGSILVDVCEKGDSYELHASLPGVPKESVKVTTNPSCPHASAFSPSDTVWSAVETSVGFALISLTLIMIRS